jgi:thioredoxin 1
MIACKNMLEEIHSQEQYNRLTATEPALLVYFSTEFCNVCKSLKPKVESLIEEEFPLIRAVYINSEKHPEIAGQHRVFTAPVILVFFEGRETIRKIRNVGINELRQDLQRPYITYFPEP